MPSSARLPGRAALAVLAALTLACSAGPTAPATSARTPPPTPAPAASGPAAGAVTISIVGTSDLHGHLEMLPYLAGYLANLRAARDGDGGGVLLVDAGDLFQGTLESNLNEGAAVIEAYEALDYDAAAIGNHEFDYGPVGPRATPRGSSGAGDDDPRGALKARLAEADFPLLAANLSEAASGAPVAWPNAPATTLVEVAGVQIGVVGVTTESTPSTTQAANFRGLVVDPLAAAIARGASELRGRGAQLVVASAHAGGRCERLDDPRDLASCAPEGEIFAVARALPPAAVDAIVAGHLHSGIAHFVNEIPVTEAFANGSSFGRIDLTVDPASGRVLDRRIFPPQSVCPALLAAKRRSSCATTAAECGATSYEGLPVVPDPAVAAIARRACEAADAVRARPLGVEVTAPVTRSYGGESALGNLFADLMRARHPTADVAIMNGGGVRADLPAGPLTYGALYEASPFDNLFATVRLAAGDLAQVVARNLAADRGVLLLSGVRARARCVGDRLEVTLLDPAGRPVPAERELTVVTSDFLASGGDGAFQGVRIAPDSVVVDADGEVVREGMAAVLTERGGTLSGEDPALFDPAAPRIESPGERPVRCP